MIVTEKVTFNFELGHIRPADVKTVNTYFMSNMTLIYTEWLRIGCILLSYNFIIYTTLNSL